MTARALGCLALLAAIASAECGAGADGPPHLEEDRTACAHCGMLVSERMFAAAYRPRAPKGRATSREARVFDDIGCLLAAARKDAAAADLEFWFNDAATREWIDGGRAVIVRAGAFKTPMAGGMLAYASSSAAAEAAREHGGRVVGGVADLLKEGAK